MPTVVPKKPSLKEIGSYLNSSLLEFAGIATARKV